MKFPVLFLDIDGVLNAHETLDRDVMCGQIHADKVKRLNDVLKRTGAMVVLSSAWRYLVHRGDMTLAGLDWLLRSHGVLQNRLIGITAPDTMVRAVYHGDPQAWPMTNERGRQIAEWLAANRHTVRYAVVDDLDFGITVAGHPLVQTDGHVGLTDADAEELVSVLSPDVVTKESSCDCGEDYPRHERLRGEIFCFTCRGK